MLGFFFKVKEFNVSMVIQISVIIRNLEILGFCLLAEKCKSFLFHAIKDLKYRMKTFEDFKNKQKSVASNLF